MIRKHNTELRQDKSLTKSFECSWKQKLLDISCKNTLHRRFRNESILAALLKNLQKILFYCSVYKMLCKGGPNREINGAKE